uniref:Sulfotransferase domain-containing protein n=1 Tax=Strigamia maritima TaxID=126957 RepID=T1JAZ7_STRMM
MESLYSASTYVLKNKNVRRKLELALSSTSIFSRYVVFLLVPELRRVADDFKTMAKFESLGVDPLFPASGELFKLGGFYVNEIHGGPKARTWLDENFEARPDDIYVISYPKTGTTWAQEMVYVIGNDLDFAKANSKPLFERFPYLECLPSIETNLITNVDKDKPRYLKSHYPYSLLPQSVLDKKCKIIYTISNPKDTLVSYYNFARKNPFQEYNGDFEAMFKLFIKEEQINCGPFSRHVLEFWERRNEDNILILHFEDMKKFEAWLNFLGKSLTDDQVQQVAEHCKFDNMSKNPSTNYSNFCSGFMRKGQVGDWKNIFTDEMNEEMNEYVKLKFGKSVDPLLPGIGEVYKCNGFYLNHEHGGIECRKWLDENFEARPDDVYVASFPKTGTTWAQELVYVIGNDLNFEKAKSTRLMQRFPYAELRIITETPAIANLETYSNFFLAIAYTPFSKHILEFWERRNQDNILILMYEDMKKDMAPAVRSIASFLGKTLSDDQVQQVVKHCTFDNMKANPSIGLDVIDGFMRKGTVGDWRNFFTEEMNQQMDDYIHRHFDGTGVDPLLPGSGEVYKCNGFYLNHEHGGIECRKWLDENFEARPDDVYVASFPKTGTTWAQELVYVIGNDLNFEKAKSTRLMQRFPYAELRIITETPAIANLESPRYIKTHYPYSLLPQSIVDKNCKIVYTIRNPKDTLVSYYHFAKSNMLFQFQGDFSAFFKYFIEERAIAYFPFSKHILEFWERRNQDNILILMYEDMKKDMAPAVRSIASFLGKTLSDDQVQQVVKHCTFDNMKANPSTNYAGVIDGFMRKGTVGDWKNFFTEEMSQEMDDYIHRHFDGTGLNFNYDLCVAEK